MDGRRTHNGRQADQNSSPGVLLCLGELKLWRTVDEVRKITRKAFNYHLSRDKCEMVQSWAILVLGLSPYYTVS